MITMKRFKVILLLTCVLFPVSGFGGEEGEEREESIRYEDITLDVDNFNLAARCGMCHIDIHLLWSQSMHSQAFVDPAFQLTYMDERIQGDERVSRHCIQCHAPTFHYNPELEFDSALVEEGVTCDFCHSVHEVDVENTSKPFTVKWGKLKRGPYKDTQSPIHETKHSPLFESGDFCGGCHQMLNLNGLPIITTYSEWKEEYYKKGGDADCQDCHMPLAAGFTVSSKFKKTKRRLNLHTFPGGHSRVQLLDALELKVLSESKLYGKMKVKLGLTNVGAGHYIPTGNPLRKVIVDFTVYDSLNKAIFTERVELSKKFGDADGNVLSTDVGILLDAAKIIKISFTKVVNKSKRVRKTKTMDK
jgi:hypothetical protein